MSDIKVCEPFQVAANYAWEEFYADIGGYSGFVNGGARTNKAAIKAGFCDMKQNGCVDIVRFWLFPDLASDGITFNGNCVTGVGGTIADDICAITEAAQECGVRIMWTYLSFDGWDSWEEKGLASYRPTLYDSIKDATCRQSFMDNLVKPITDLIKACPGYSATYHSTDLFNEPDWGIVDTNPVLQGQDWTTVDFNNYNFDDNPLSYSQMYTFLDEMADAVRERDSNACITIGTASKKWASAWQPIVDFNSPHSYGFDQAYFPIDQPPSAWGLTKPSFIGEYPASGYNQATATFPGSVPGALPKSHTQWLSDAVQSGWLGAFAWAYTVDNDTGAVNGGYNSTTRAEAKIWAEANVKSVDRIELNPSSIDCGTSQQVSFQAVSVLGEPVDVNGIVINAGTLTNVLYDADTCTYTATYTAPSCPDTVVAVMSATDDVGNLAQGTIAVNGETVQTCSSGCSVGVTVGVDSPCTDFSFSITCIDDTTSCSCKPTMTQLTNYDESCPPIGASLIYQVTGCDCSDSTQCCKYAGWRFTEGKPVPSWVTNDSVCLESGILTVGPIKGVGKIPIDLECIPCAEDETCVDCPDCPDCEVCEDCDDELTAAQIAQIQVLAAACTTDTITAAAALKTGTTANQSGITANIPGLSQSQNAQVDQVIADCVVDTIVMAVESKE